MADLIYFAAKAIILKDEKVLVLYSNFDGQRSWDFPGGRMIFGEDTETTLIREVYEETKLTVKPLQLIDTWHHTKGDFHVTGVFYLVETDHYDVQLSDEHDGFEWVPMKDINKIVQSKAYMSRIMNWDFSLTASGYEINKTSVKSFSINELRPNNLYLSEEKVNTIFNVYQQEQQEFIPPILVTSIQNEWVVLDGHSRLYVAYKEGFKKINAIYKELNETLGPVSLYEKIHALAKLENINSIADLENRILSPEDHKTYWVDLCDDLTRHKP